MSPVTMGAARDGPGGVAVQPGAVAGAGLGGVRAAGGPPGPDLRGPFFLQRRAALQAEQVGQGDVDPGLDRLPGPLRQQPGRGQPAHAPIGLLHREFDHIDGDAHPAAIVT
jgi:hypothetical protein